MGSPRWWSQLRGDLVDGLAGVLLPLSALVLGSGVELHAHQESIIVAVPPADLETTDLRRRLSSVVVEPDDVALRLPARLDGQELDAHIARRRRFESQPVRLNGWCLVVVHRLGGGRLAVGQAAAVDDGGVRRKRGADQVEGRHGEGQNCSCDQTAHQLLQISEGACTGSCITRLNHLDAENANRYFSIRWYDEDMKEILGDYEPFVENINRGLKQVGINRDELSMMDHICYRVETNGRYFEMLSEIAKRALLLGESEINGRLIATFELYDPLETGGWVIPYLELPQPKPGSPYPEGLEHAELIPVRSLDAFRARHDDLVFDESGMDKKINPELGLKAAGMSVKFHEQSLGAVVRLEQRLGL